MGVTLKIADHAAKSWPTKNVTSKDELLAQSCGAEYRRSDGIIQSSLDPKLFSEAHISPSTNGFVFAAYEAYSRHHHLTIRPDDIWFAILSQLNYYINAHAEELRSHFVSHEGQKDLVIEQVPPIDFSVFARQMTHLIQENVKDPDFRDWIMPTFSTTTVSDRTTAAVLMMGSMQAYFSYTSFACCGIPSVTLLGNKEDYEDILSRLDKLEELGTEPTAFADLLRPIIQHFILTFDPSQSDKTREFWTRIAHYQGGSGFSHLSGWLTAFCFWRNDGKSLYFQCYSDTTTAKTDQPDSEAERYPDFGNSAWSGTLVIGGVRYPTLNYKDVPNGWAAVPVIVTDGVIECKTRMVAGSLGIVAETSEQNGEEGTEVVQLDSVKSLSGWFMYRLKEEKEGGDESVPQPYPWFLQ